MPQAKPDINQILGNIQFLRVTNLSAKEKIITVGMVSERLDSYNTVITPNGLVTPVESVLVDYNHNRISTGATLKDLGVQKIKVMQNGQEIEIESRVVEIRVGTKNKAWTQKNKDQRADEVPSLFEYVDSGRIGWVSVDFDAIESDTDYIYDAKGNLKRVVFNKWRLNYLSLLDVKPGQDDSFFLNVRMNKNLHITNKPMHEQLKQLRAKVIELLKEKFSDAKEFTDITVQLDSDESGTVRAIADEAKSLEVEFTVSDTEVTLGEVRSEEIDAQASDVDADVDGSESDESDGSADEPEADTDKGEDEAPEDVADGSPEAASDGSDTEVVNEEAETRAAGERAYVGGAVKELSTGKLGVVTKIEESQEAGQEPVCKSTVKMLDGTEVVVDGKITYSDEASKSGYVYASSEAVMLAMMAMMATDKQEDDSEEEEGAEDVRKQLEAKDAEVLELSRKLKETNKLLRAVDKTNLRADAGTVDLDGDSKDDVNVNEQESRQLDTIYHRALSNTL